jgi:hypothetical protein
MSDIVERLKIRGMQPREMPNHYTRRMEVERIEAACEITTLRDRLAEVEAALKLTQDLDAINVAEIARLTDQLATARRDALEEAADVAVRMEREMGIQDECGYEPFYTPEDVARFIRALAQEEPTT